MKNERTFSAFVERNGMTLIEYTRVRDRIQVVSQAHTSGEFVNPLEAAEELGNMLGSQNAVGAKLTLVLRGMGTCYHILVLPPAKEDILRPVVGREMSRLYPDVEDPVVDFVRGPVVERRRRERREGGQPPTELLAAAISRGALEDFEQGTGTRDIVIQHVTVLPRVMQRLFEEIGSPPEPVAVIILLNGGPIVGFFHENQLRLVVEPPGETADGLRIEPQGVIEQLERGNMYLRQQFRGAQISRLYLSADADAYAAIAQTVEESMGIGVSPFAPDVETPGVLAAIGGVLDSGDEGLNLAERSALRPDRSEVWTRGLSVASVVLLGLLTWGWALIGVMQVTSARERVESLRSAVAQRAAPIQPLREVAIRRRAHAARVAVISRIADEKAQLAQILRVINIGATSGVRVDRFTMARDDQMWTTSLAGVADAGSSAQALSQVHEFYRDIPRSVGAPDVTLSDLQFADSAKAGTTSLKFQMSFVVPAAPGSPASPAAGAQPAAPPPAGAAQ